MTQTRLERIMTAHRAAAHDDRRSLDQLLEQAQAKEGVRDFADALRGSQLSVISEIKRRSPSAGDLNPLLDPRSLASAYEAGGAACLSVLTDEAFFGGSPDDLDAARSAVSLPVLRKDFTVDARDIADARLMGADAILLIVAGLSDDELHRFHALALSVRLSVLVEVHDATELERAKAIPDLQLLGVNQRNLHTFEITDAASSLRDSFPTDVIAVAESGITSVGDAQRMSDLGYDAILVGTSLVTAGDPQATLNSFANVGRS